MTDFNIKRYIKTSNYPKSMEPIGTIILVSDAADDFDLSIYPHIYRLLNWWEYRCPEEMPEYVEKISENDGYHVKGDLLKVEWKYNYQNNVTKGKSFWVAVVGNHFYNADKLIPRNKEEYDKAPAEHKPHC